MEEKEDNFEISEKDFKEVVKKFQMKNKRGYDFLEEDSRSRFTSCVRE